MDKSRVKGILLNYLNDYYAEYPEELDSGEIANWGELDSYYEDYPEIFQKLVDGDPDDPEVEELWNFAEKVWDAWITFAKASNALDESTTNKKIENRLAEAFEKTIKSLQKEGLFENVKSFNLDFTGKEIAVKLNESTSLNEMADIDRMDWNEVLPNPYASSPHVKNIHPELRWCEFLAAAYFYPKAHNGDLLHPQVYQGKAGWANPNQDVPYFTWLTQAGYIERVKTPGSIGKGAYKVTPAGERVMRYMIRAFGERACNPFEVVKGDRMDRHNLEPRKTKQKDQMYQGEVAFSYQGVHDAAPRERTVLPVAVYDRDIDVGDQRRIFGYDTGNMDERTVRALKRIFYNVNQEMKDKLGVESDLKGIKLSQLITNNFSEEENEIYKAIQDKARGRIAAYDADKYYRNFKLDRAEKVEPTNRGSTKTGKLNADDRAFFDANHSSNYIEDDFED